MEYIIGVLETQNAELLQLMEYMKEEYELLIAGKPEPLAEISFAMQDCIRRIEEGRKAMMATLGCPLTQYCKTLPPKQAEQILSLSQIVQSQESMCKEQAEYNKALALGMIEQCRKNIAFIQEAMATHITQGYMPSGALHKTIVQGTLLEGRL